MRLAPRTRSAAAITSKTPTTGASTVADRSRRRRSSASASADRASRGATEYDDIGLERRDAPRRRQCMAVEQLELSIRCHRLSEEHPRRVHRGHVGKRSLQVGFHHGVRGRNQQADTLRIGHGSVSQAVGVRRTGVVARLRIRPDRLVRRNDIPVLGVDVEKARAVWLGIDVGDALPRDEGPEAALQRVDDRRPHATARRAAADDDGVDAFGPQDRAQPGPVERARELLRHELLLTPLAESHVDLDVGGTRAGEPQGRALLEEQPGIAQVGSLIGDAAEDHAHAGCSRSVQQPSRLLDRLREVASAGDRRIDEAALEVDDQDDGPRPHPDATAEPRTRIRGGQPRSVVHHFEAMRYFAKRQVSTGRRRRPSSPPLRSVSRRGLSPRCAKLQRHASPGTQDEERGGAGGASLRSDPG